MLQRAPARPATFWALTGVWTVVPVHLPAKRCVAQAATSRRPFCDTRVLGAPPPPASGPRGSPALGRPSELVRSTRRGDTFSQGHGPECVRPHLLLARPRSLRLRHGSVAQWHLVDLLGKPGGPQGPLGLSLEAGPLEVAVGLASAERRVFLQRGWGLGSLGSLPTGWHGFRRPRLSSRSSLSPALPRGLGGTRRQPGGALQTDSPAVHLAASEPTKGRGTPGGMLSRHQPDPRAPASSGPSESTFGI